MNKEEKVNETQRRIIEAAIREFGTKGYQAASTNGICEACGISKGLIFYHFKSKELLFEECAKFCINEFDRYMQKNYISSKTPLEGLRSCCLMRKNFFYDHPSYHKIFCEVLYRGEAGENKESKLRKMYEKHSYVMLDKILEGAVLNSRNSREDNINIAVQLIQFIDMQTYQSNQETAQMLEEQMKRYEALFGALFYGILEQ